MPAVKKDQKPQVATLDAWAEAATHYPLLPSGVRVGIRIPDLALMIETGQIPQHLMDVALGVAGGTEAPKPTKELIQEQKEFTDKLVQLTVVEPALPDEILPKLPYEDKEFIVAVATRTRDLDAEGEHLAGLTNSAKFRKFRRLGEFDQDVEGL